MGKISLVFVSSYLVMIYMRSQKSDMLFVHIQGTEHLVWLFFQTRRQSTALSPPWARIEPGTPVLRNSDKMSCQNEDPLATLPPRGVPVLSIWFAWKKKKKNLPTACLSSLLQAFASIVTAGEQENRRKASKPDQVLQYPLLYCTLCVCVCVCVCVYASFYYMFSV